MKKKTISAPSLPAPVGPYSPAIEFDGTLYCSGQIALDPKTNQLIQGDVSAQTKQIMLNIGALLQAGDMNFDNVVKTLIFLTDMNDFNAVNEIYGSHFKNAPPARSTVAVSGLPRGAKVEIEVLARR